MIYSEDTLVRLIDRIYDAALAPELWPRFLEALAEVIDGHVANLAHGDTRRNEIVVAATARFDPEAVREYAEYYGALDPWVKSGKARGFFRTGGMGLGKWVVPASDLQKTEFYNDFGRRYRISGGISVILRMEQDVVSALSVTECGREFGEDEVALVKRLLPHLQRALQVHERLAAVTGQLSAADEIIDRLPFGVVLVDATGRAVLVNMAAQHILDTRDGLTLRDNNLVTTTLPQTTKLLMLVAGAIAASRGEGVEAGGALALGRPSLKRPLQVLVTPLRARGASLRPGSADACAAIFISDPELQEVTDEVMLQQFYGFTSAETRFATQLLEHKSVEEAADFLEVSLNTARTHLKKLFEKTDTRRQSELMRLLGGGVGQLRR